MAIYQVGSHFLAHGETGARTWSAAPPPPPPATYRAILAIGESNAGGQAPNATASPASLLDPTARVQILNITTGLFENMDIGTNNNIGHDGVPDETTHGWEIGLTTYLDENPEQLEPIYYIQAGQGGSVLAQWVEGSGYWNTAETRINQAKARFTALGISPVWEIWFTLGINDWYAGSPITPAAYNAGCITFLNSIRTLIGNGTATRIRSPQFMAYHQTNYPTYTAEHEALATDMVNFQIIPTTGLPVLDDDHWSSAGYFEIGKRLAAL